MDRTITKRQFPQSSAQEERVAGYARVSCGKDAMLRSLAAQVSYYSALIQNHPGWHFVGVYADEALTGTKDTRPDFQRLIEDCRAGKIDLTVTNAIIMKGQFPINNTQGSGLRVFIYWKR